LSNCCAPKALLIRRIQCRRDTATEPVRQLPWPGIWRNLAVSSPVDKGAGILTTTDTTKTVSRSLNAKENGLWRGDDYLGLRDTLTRWARCACDLWRNVRKDYVALTDAKAAFTSEMANGSAPDRQEVVGLKVRLRVDPAKVVAIACSSYSYLRLCSVDRCRRGAKPQHWVWTIQTRSNIVGTGLLVVSAEAAGLQEDNGLA
jgi:hypothetical protein